MAGYSEEVIQEVINANDIVDVVSGYVQLKRAGRNYTGLCPFHKEKTPSFIVSPDKQIYHCFGCGEGGNVISFVMKVEGIDFMDTIELLAQKAGITLQRQMTPYNQKMKDEKDRIYMLNKEVANHFYKNLYSQSGKSALEYLYNRKLDDETIKKFGLGFSINRNEMFDFLKEKGYTETEILKSAIVEKKENRYVDKFRNRLMFPIVDIRDRVIAFGGRVMDNSKPKYINSPDTVIYSKGKNLFALNVVKKQRVDKILIVEGYMDTISLHQRGINNVVASLGTALTVEQAKLLSRYCKEIVVGYDSDEAGQAATLRGLDILSSAGCEVKVLQLDTKDVKDPDEYIIKYGSGRFNNLINNAITLVEYKLNLLLSKYDITKIDEKVKFLNEMAKVLAVIDNDIEIDVYVKKISDDTGITKEPIYAEINKLKFKYANDLKNISAISEKTNLKLKKANNNNITQKAELYIIFLLLEKNINIYNLIKQKVNLDYIENLKYKEIIEVLYSYYENELYKSMDALQLFSNDEELQIISSTICLEYNDNNIGKIIEDIAKTLLKNKLEKRKIEISKILTQENIEDKEELEKELSEILIKIKRI